MFREPTLQSGAAGSYLTLTKTLAGEAGCPSEVVCHWQGANADVKSLANIVTIPLGNYGWEDI